MEKGEKSQKPRSKASLLRGREKIGESGYLNENCWLAKSLNYSPAKRCQYCTLKFHNCLFLQYGIISLILVLFFLTLSFLFEGKISKLAVIFIFILVIIYGYFFNKNTEKIIKANFAEKKANEALKELTQNLQQKVDEQTEEIKAAYEVEKKAHELDIKVRKESERLDEAKTQFMMATQHHLRTPLTSMNGYMELLLDGSYGKIPPKIKEVLKKLQISTRNEIRIVEELLNISQFQVGKDIVALKPGVDIEKILKEIMEDLTLEAKKKNIYLKLEKPLTLPKIKADPDKLNVALTNIIDNAVKYTNKGGVTVRCKTTDSKLQIIIKDTGMGIPKEDLDDIFDRVFERGRGAHKVFALGRGIGLYITSQIIKAHNGKIWAESEGKDRGSTFFVELPVTDKLK